MTTAAACDSAPKTRRRTKAVILAAGAGTRLRPLTDRMAKCMVPVAGRPLLDYWLEALARIGVRDILVNTHAHAEQVREHLARLSGRASGLHAMESYEPELLGSAGTLAANAGFAEGASEVFIVYADNFSCVDLRAMLATHREATAPFTMLLFHAENPSACGIAELDGDGRIVSFVEKPERPASDLANAGVYVLSPEAYAEVAGMRAFDFGFEVIPRFVGRMQGYLHPGYHRDVGTPQSYEQTLADAPGLLSPLGQLADGQRRAVFLDRDGTLIEHVHYLKHPSQVRLVPGCGEALRRLRDAGFVLVVVTNQAAMAKGLLDETGLAAVHERMFELLADEQVSVDAVYHCPLAGTSGNRGAIDHPDRKPGPGMLVRGAKELGLSLERSYMIGDMASDVLAGRNAGCRQSLLLTGGAPLSEDEHALVASFPQVPDIIAACDWVLADAAR